MDHRLLENYFQGKCSEQEKATVESWLSREEELPDLGPEKLDGSRQEEWAVLHDRISRSQRQNFHLWWYWAACVLLVGSLFFWFDATTFNKTDIADVHWKTLAVPNGQAAKVTLADGSLVELNGGSSLVYPDRFSDTRSVKLLKGEAFFRIVKDTAHAFTLQTMGDGLIRVLGTRFNVKHNRYKSSLEIILNSGKIKFSRNHEAFLLAPGQQLIYNLTNKTVTAPLAVDTAATALWRKGTLLFRDTPLKQAFNELEQHFGVTFIIDAIIDNQLFTAEFNKEPLIRILKLMEKGTDLKFKVDGKNIHVSK